MTACIHDLHISFRTESYRSSIGVTIDRIVLARAGLSDWVGQQINNSPHRYKVTVTNLAKSSGDRGIVLFAPSWAFCFFSVP